MKHLMTWGTLGAVTVLGLGIMTSAYSQRPTEGGQTGAQVGRQPQGKPPVHSIMRTGSEGVFVLTGNDLVKYDATTLKEAGRLTLEAGMPAVPKTDATAGAQANPPQGPPPPPGILYIPEGDLSDQVIVILGTNFYRIDGDKLQVKAKSPLPITLPTPPQGGPGMGPGGPGMGPGGQGGPQGQGGWGPPPQGEQQGQGGWGPPQGGPQGRDGMQGPGRGMQGQGRGMQGGPQGGPQGQRGQGGPGMGPGGQGGQGGPQGQGMGPGGPGMCPGGPGMMGGPGGPGGPGRGPELQLEGKTLYLMLRDQILAIDVMTGSVKGDLSLSADNTTTTEKK